MAAGPTVADPPHCFTQEVGSAARGVGPARAVKTFTVFVTHDTVQEPNETFTVTLAYADPGLARLSCRSGQRRPQTSPLPPQPLATSSIARPGGQHGHPGHRTRCPARGPGHHHVGQNAGERFHCRPVRCDGRQHRHPRLGLSAASRASIRTPAAGTWCWISRGWPSGRPRNSRHSLRRHKSGHVEPGNPVRSHELVCHALWRPPPKGRWASCSGGSQGPGSLGCCTVTLPQEASLAGVSFRSEPLSMPGEE